MIPNEIIDAKVGTRQVTAIYLGENLVWPAVPIHYVITDARLVYSTGARLDAGVVGSQYTGNYAYALGTVRVQQGQVIIRELTDVPLNLSVSSQDFHVLRESGISYDIIRGNNLGTTETTAIKSTAVTVSYRDATPRSVGNVEQIINSYTEVVNEWTEWDTEPTITPSPISGSYWVTIYLTNYDSPNRTCPAYGGYASLYVNAGHDEADFSTLGWATMQSYTRTYASHAVETSTPVIIDQGTTPPEQVGDAYAVDDTPTLNTLPSWLTLTGTNLEISSEHDDPYPDGRSFTITASNGTATPMSATVYQQENEATPDYIYDTVYGESYITYDNSNYYVSVSANRYGSASDSAPASGGVYAILSVNAHHTVVDVTHTPYQIYETPHWVWTSGEETYGTRQLVVDDEDVARGTPRQNTDTGLVPVITMSSSQGADAFSWDGAQSRIEIPTEDVYVYQNGRNAHVVFTNGDASDDLYLYQAANTRSTSYSYDLSVAIQQDGNIPANGGTLYVTYRSYSTATETYSSGSTKVLDATPYSSTVTGTNCTPSVNSASGQGAFQITVDANTSTTNTRSVSVRLAATSTEYVTSTKVQDKATPSVQKVATLMPWMINMQGTPFVVGKVYYQFTIDSGTLTSGTLTGVNFCWRVNGGTKNTVQIGTFSVSETSQPTALEPSGVNIPSFSSGTGLVTAWFEVTASKGGFDTINADEDNYSFTITF